MSLDSLKQARSRLHALEAARRLFRRFFASRTTRQITRPVENRAELLVAADDAFAVWLSSLFTGPSSDFTTVLDNTSSNSSRFGPKQRDAYQAYMVTAARLYKWGRTFLTECEATAGITVEEAVDAHAFAHVSSIAGLDPRVPRRPRDTPLSFIPGQGMTTEESISLTVVHSFALSYMIPVVFMRGDRTLGRWDDAHPTRDDETTLHPAVIAAWNEYALAAATMNARAHGYERAARRAIMDLTGIAFDGDRFDLKVGVVSPETLDEGGVASGLRTTAARIADKLEDASRALRGLALKGEGLPPDFMGRVAEATDDAIRAAAVLAVPVVAGE